MRPLTPPKKRAAVSALLLVCAFASAALALPFIGGGGKCTVTITAAEAAIRTVLNNKTLGWSKQMEAAAANVLGKPSEDFVAPGATKAIVVQRDAKATVIVVEGNFCKKTGADWYFIQPAKKKSLKLTAGATGFTLTTGK